MNRGEARSTLWAYFEKKSFGWQRARTRAALDILKRVDADSWSALRDYHLYAQPVDWPKEEAAIDSLIRCMETVSSERRSKSLIEAAPLGAK